MLLLCPQWLMTLVHCIDTWSVCVCVCVCVCVSCLHPFLLLIRSEGSRKKQWAYQFNSSPFMKLESDFVSSFKTN